MVKENIHIHIFLVSQFLGMIAVCASSLSANPTTDSQCEIIRESLFSELPAKQILALKKRKIDLNQPCAYPIESGYLDYPALVYAVIHLDFPAIRALVEAGANVNVPDETGTTPLMLARDSETARLLIKAGARVNYRNKNGGQTPLLYAVSDGREEIVRLLIEAKADVNMMNDDQTSALMLAVELGNIQIIQRLISAKANLSLRNKSGQSALDLAIKAGRREAIPLLEAAQKKLKDSEIRQVADKGKPGFQSSKQRLLRINMQDGSVYIGELISESDLDVIILQKGSRFQIKKSLIKHQEPVGN